MRLDLSPTQTYFVILSARYASFQVKKVNVFVFFFYSTNKAIKFEMKIPKKMSDHPRFTRYSGPKHSNCLTTSFIIDQN